jgi:indole-3-acetate O-methyltransferase
MSGKSDENHDKHVPYGKKGTGYYSDHTLGCFRVIEKAQKQVLEAIESVMLDVIVAQAHNKPMESFNFADLGAADGGTSMNMWKTVFQYIRGRESANGSCATPICLYYEDQPINDFTSLFMRIHGLLPTTYRSNTQDKDFFGKIPEVYTFASGTSFHKQCFPSNSIIFEFSSTAIHWLRDKPPSLQTVIHSSLVPWDLDDSHDADPSPLSQDIRTKHAIERQSMAELVEMLRQRSKELVKGGRCLFLLLAEDEQGQYLGKTRSFPNSVLDILNRLWKQMSQEGIITETEFINTTMCNFYRRKSKVLEIFDNADFINGEWSILL